MREGGRQKESRGSEGGREGEKRRVEGVVEAGREQCCQLFLLQNPKNLVKKILIFLLMY